MIAVWGLLWTVVALLLLAATALVYSLQATRRIARQAERHVPPPGRFIEIDGNRIHYVEAGSGRPILFVHGLGGSLFNFVHPLFDALAGDYRLVAVDRPGSGYSTRRGQTPASPIEQADFLVRFMAELKLERPLVVGHSLGGAITLALALNHPRLISGIALIAPLTQHHDAPPPEFRALAIRSPALRRLIAETVSTPFAIRNRDRVLSFVFGPQTPPEDYAVAGGAMASLRPSHFYATSTDLVAIGDDMKTLAARYGEIAMPAGLLAGTGDRVLNADEHARAMEQAIPGLDLELVEGAGHMPQYAVKERVVAFIRRMAARSFGDSGLAQRLDGQSGRIASDR